MHKNELKFEFCLYDAQEIMFTCAEQCDLFDSPCQKVCTELYIEEGYTDFTGNDKIHHRIFYT